jgi:hypothetical protein
MTRAEIIAKLKEAKGPMPAKAASEFAMETVKTFGFTTDGAYQLLYSALTDEHPWSLAFAVMLSEHEKPGEWISITFNSSQENAAEAAIGANYSERGATPAIALVIALIGGE